VVSLIVKYIGGPRDGQEESVVRDHIPSGIWEEGYGYERGGRCKSPNELPMYEMHYVGVCSLNDFMRRPAA
jgi:hypothetical protein